MDDILYFTSPSEMYKWLASNHHSVREQWVGFYKKGSGYPSITWSESVDVALCFGWIDGVRKNVDSIRYKIRFTPRKPQSHWSSINLQKVKALINNGMMTPQGLRAYNGRKITPPLLDKESKLILKELAGMWNGKAEEEKFFLTCPIGYRRLMIKWISAGKKVETRAKRIKILIEHCLQKKRVPLI